MFETFVTLCCLFTILAYLTTKKLGLLDPVPRDPKARVASYCSGVMCLLKDHLIQARIEQCAPDRVTFVKAGVTGSIWHEGENVHSRYGAKESLLPLGDKGTLTFAQLDGDLSVEIVAAESEGAEHTTRITLPLAN